MVRFTLILITLLEFKIIYFYKNLQFNSNTVHLSDVIVFEDICTFMFFAVIFYKCQPKDISAIIAMGAEEEVLTINYTKTKLIDGAE